jgi:hypothetical protein
MCPIPNGFRDRPVDVVARIRQRQDALRRATRHVLTRVEKCNDIDGGIFENVLYYVNCTNFITSAINTGKTVHNISLLSTILELYSEIALSRKPF